MFKSITRLLLVIVLVGSAAAVTAANLWSAKIDNVYVYSDGKAKIFLGNLNSPHPNNTNQTGTGCTSNGVWLAPNSLSEKASSELLSLSLTLFASKTPVRISITGKDADCYVFYMGSQS
tara:strand:+ start:8770 stop:9126 length:357 start_codon:yes stop_codon:yes gene_type:complete